MVDGLVLFGLASTWLRIDFPSHKINLGSGSGEFDCHPEQAFFAQ
jgi:hypothetical protein